MHNQNPWGVREDSFDPAHLHHRETIFTIGNGYLCTRGAYEEGYPGQEAATFIHGVFEDTPLFFTELVNTPDWTALEILVAGERFSLARGEILAYERILDLYSGVLSRRVRWRSQAGNTVELHFERFASLADPHKMLVLLTVRPIDFSGEVQVRTGLNAAVDTLGRIHWDLLDQWVSEDDGSSDPPASSAKASLDLRTRKSGIETGIALRLSVQGGNSSQIAGWDVRGHPTLTASVQGRQGESVRFEKVVTVYTSLEVDQPWQAACDALDKIPLSAWKGELEAHLAFWEKEWQVCDVVIEGDEEMQLAVRFNLYHLLIAAPRQDRRVSIGAKTLSGFAYRGHVFWDTEIFMLPFFTYTNPQIARNLLQYRCHTLPGARRKARANGYEGAQFAWESAATGDEVTPVWIPHFQEPHNLVRIWTGDIEIHISADISYAILQYWQASGDEAFLVDCGLEIILETALFWASRAEWDDARRRYEFNDIIGPDEYHDHVDNNAYTNYIARWHLKTAGELLQWARSNHGEKASMLMASLGITQQVLEGWAEIAENIYLPHDPRSGLIEQFDGYFKRQDVDLEQYAGRTQSMQAILGIAGANQTQVLKQPDVLMLLYLFPDLFDTNVLHANYEYYSPRTDYTYGSSVGPAIQSILSCRLGRIEEAYKYFTLSALADLRDVRGNASDGIHGASAGGLWQALVFGFGGLNLDGDEFSLRPSLPEHWQSLAFSFTFRGKQYRIGIYRQDQGFAWQVLEQS